MSKKYIMILYIIAVTTFAVVWIEIHFVKYQNADIKYLLVREWICPVCQVEHDRDVNAANSILAEWLQ